jgi:dTDP-glucose 4,6-dehydratase
MAANYTPKNILITGAAGFIGSNVCVRLVQKYPHYNIFNYDKLDYCASLKNLDEIKDAKNYTFIKGDILSADLVNYVIKSHDIDTIMHFAAQTHVDNSFGNSITFTSNNVLGTHVLLECAKANNIKRFIFVSTDEVYGESSFQDGAIESTVLQPTNPYSATKAGAEHLVKSYFKSFNLPVIISRGGNVYGPKQYPEKVIPKFIGLLSRGKPCCIHGDGSHRRSYLFVSDVVNAFDIILHKGVTGEVYNMGTSFEISNLEFAKKLIDIFGLKDRESEFIDFVEDRPFNDLRYSLNSSKLRELGWRPEIDFDEGLARTILWYKANFNNWNTAETALAPHPSLPTALSGLKLSQMF